MNQRAIESSINGRQIMKYGPAAVDRPLQKVAKAKSSTSFSSHRMIRRLDPWHKEPASRARTLHALLAARRRCSRKDPPQMHISAATSCLHALLSVVSFTSPLTRLGVGDKMPSVRHRVMPASFLKKTAVPRDVHHAPFFESAWRAFANERRQIPNASRLGGAFLGFSRHACL